jgi:arabinogalactan endo-1,4-beta-galactosidase
MKKIPMLATALFAVFSTQSLGADRYFGADLSFANEMEDCGAVYRENGAPIDVYKLFWEHGANLIRIRIWNDADWTKYSNLADVKKSIARARALGMKVLLDFHYSDDWADGDRQIIPKAWADIKDETALSQALYQYTYDTLTDLDREGLMPDMVQTGNEINGELLGQADWKGRPIDWERNARLLNAAIKAVRDAGAKSTIKPKVMLHIAQPENVEPWFQAATASGIADFDAIGISYYRKWSKETIAELGATIRRLIGAYPKADVMVVETGYPWTKDWADNTPNQLGGDDSIDPAYPASPAGQAKYLIDLSQTVISNGGVGVVYWAPDWVSTQCTTRWGSGSAWENATFFDFHRKDEVLPAIDFMRLKYSPPSN